MKRVYLVAGIALFAATLAGCGGPGVRTATPGSATTLTSTPAIVTFGKQAYDRRMKTLGRQLGGSVEQLFPLGESSPGSDTNRQALVKLERARAVVTRVMVNVAGIAPPTPIREEHRQLLRGIAALAAELDTLIQVETKGASTPFGTYTRFASLRTIARATSAIERKGYAIG